MWSKQKRREYNREWNKAHPGASNKWNKAHPEYQNEYTKKRLRIDPKFRKTRNEAYKKWREKNPDYANEYKYATPQRLKEARARVTLNNHISSGRILKLPCEVCGNDKSEGHHNNYSKPLDVKWLCKLHHEEYHRNLVAQKSK